MQWQRVHGHGHLPSAIGQKPCVEHVYIDQSHQQFYRHCIIKSEVNCECLNDSNTHNLFHWDNEQHNLMSFEWLDQEWELLMQPCTTLIYSNTRISIDCDGWRWFAMVCNETNRPVVQYDVWYVAQVEWYWKQKSTHDDDLRVLFDAVVISQRRIKIGEDCCLFFCH